jgi:uncharacterized membrane protein
LDKTQKLTISALIIACYIVLIAVFQNFSFGAINIRVSNCLYALCFTYPFLIIPMGIAVILSNLVFGGLGLIDIICGSIITMITCFIISKLKKVWMIPLPMIFIVGFSIPLYLSFLLNIPYIILMPAILVGQIVPAILGVFIIKKLNKN